MLWSNVIKHQNTYIHKYSHEHSYSEDISLSEYSQTFGECKGSLELCLHRYVFTYAKIKMHRYIHFTKHKF